MKVAYLDGLRGLAALWVLVGHCLLLTGMHIPLMSSPDLGVDLFILLSGFLMVYQYQIRCKFENWEKPQIWVAFWIRRIFRLSPLYYCVLIIGLVMMGNYLYSCRLTIDHFLGAHEQLRVRYTDSSLTNVAAHLSYTFGLIPSYAFRTPLPDWSLGLEMQFYAAFPFIMILMRKVGWLAGAALLAALGIGVTIAFHYAKIVYPMPSFLALKLHMFLAGMLIASASGQARKTLYLVAACALAIVPIGTSDILHLAVRSILTISFFAFAHCQSNGTTSFFTKLLSCRPAVWLGELSFGVYLIHLLVLMPVDAEIIRRFEGDISNAVRFCIVVTIVVPLAYGLAFLTYKFIEKPGQSIGKSVLKLWTKSLGAEGTLPEKIAAP